MTTLDYRTAFDLAPIGLVLSRRRLMTDCNRELLAMFGAERDDIVGRSFEALYPTPGEFELTGVRIVTNLDKRGRYADERVMRRLDGSLFWCHVSGRALDAKDPHAAGIWAFEDLSNKRVVAVEFTPREREIAALLVQGRTSKAIGRQLAVSPRTVDVYRGRLMRKMGAATTGELVRKLMS